MDHVNYVNAQCASTAGVQETMVLCVVVGCSSRSGRDKGISFFRIPRIVKNRGENVEQLSKKRCAGYISAIMRKNLTDKIQSNDRICSGHFLSGYRPADLRDEGNPD